MKSNELEDLRLIVEAVAKAPADRKLGSYQTKAKEVWDKHHKPVDPLFEKWIHFSNTHIIDTEHFNQEWFFENVKALFQNTTKPTGTQWERWEEFWNWLDGQGIEESFNKSIELGLLKDPQHYTGLDEAIDFYSCKNEWGSGYIMKKLKEIRDKKS